MVRALSAFLTAAVILTAEPVFAQPPVTPAPPPPTAVTPAPQPSEVPLLIPPPPAEAGPVMVPELPCPCQPAPKPRLFGSIEVDLIFPHVTNGLASPVVIRPFNAGDYVMLPAAGLDTTTAPQFTLGYRLDGDIGAILLSYRNLASDGRDFFHNFDFAGDGVVVSRLDINTVGLTYSTSEHPLGALWSMRWELGAKLSSIYFDSQGQGQVIGQHVSNYFIGAGPSVALDLTRELPSTGLALYSRAEFADLLGQVTQRFSETVGDPVQPDGFGSFDQSGSQAVPMLAVQAGLSWLSHPDGRYRLTAGYSYEHYWMAGKLGSNHGDVMGQGLFLRGEFNY
jgi:hypothetical protein